MFIVNLLAVVLTFNFVGGNAFSNIPDLNRQFCPPDELIKPCVCYKNSISSRLTLQCSGFRKQEDLRQIFKQIKNSDFKDVIIENSNMEYIPASILEHVAFENLNVSSVTLTSLFDEPLKSIKLNIQILASKFIRGMNWNLLTNSEILEFEAFNADFKKFGQSFRDEMPRTVNRFWIENTKTIKIEDGAFENLKNLTVIGFQHNHITSIKRNMFATPSKLVAIVFSYNRISSLPDDIFQDMPDLKVVMLGNNQLVTLSETIFIKKPVFYFIENNPLNCDCDMKWITVDGKAWPHLFAGTCSKPNFIQEREIKNLKKEDFEYCRAITINDNKSLNSYKMGKE